jgi:hypothetical protein
MTCVISSSPPDYYSEQHDVIRIREFCADHTLYEAEKALWRARHPDATPTEYEHAMRAIARTCGV